ncbi:metallophosphoesterase family protein [Palleronia aestuarii]
MPGSVPDGTEVFAVGDIHGRADLLSACLDEIAETEREPGTERVIVLLGDLIDRGPDSLRAIRLALDTDALTRADRFVLLPGNHELMLLDVLDGVDPALWIGNGGATLMDEIEGEWRRRPWSDSLRLLNDRLPDGFADMVRAAPSNTRIGDFVFVHAGLDPEVDDAVHLDRRRPVDDRHWAWIRHEFLTWQGGWDVESETGARAVGRTIVVHGHTPALRGRLTGNPGELAPLDGVDTHCAVCLDAGAAYRPQVGWARFWRDGETTLMQIHATYDAQLDAGWLP